MQLNTTSAQRADVIYLEPCCVLNNPLLTNPEIITCDGTFSQACETASITCWRSDCAFDCSDGSGLESIYCL